MDLPLDIISTRTVGRAPKPLSAVMLRPLAEADLALLSEEKGSKPAPLKRIRDRHHAIARLLAAGKKPGEVAAICGYDVSRISILQGDPAFTELLNFYRDGVNQEYASLHEQLAGMSLDAAIILRERMEEGEDLSVGQLLEITKMGADRTGLGPSSQTNLNVNINLADRLEAARKRRAVERTNPLIDITPEAPNASV